MAFKPRHRRAARQLQRATGWSRRLVVGAAIALGILAVAAILVFARPAVPGGAAAARHYLARSMALLRTGNATGARDAARDAVDADPAWGLAHAMLARSLLELGEGGAAQAEIARATANGFDPRRAHQLLAQAYLQSGDPVQALAQARQTPDLYAGYATRVAALAMAAQGRLPEAQRLLAQLLERADGNNADAWADLGRVRQMTGDLGGAAAAVSRALALNPRLVRAVVLRAELVRDQYGLIAALPWYRAALSVDPDNHDALIGYAATLGDAGRNQEMLAAVRRAQAARPSSDDAFYLQAVLAARAGNAALARGLMARVDGRFAREPGPLFLSGMLDYGAGADSAAILKLRQLIGQQPMNIEARRVLGAALARSGDARGALAVLRPVALRGDADSYTLSLVGRAFEASGERDWAWRYLDRAATAAFTPAMPFGTDDSLDDLRAKAAASPDDPVAAVGYIRGLIDAGRQQQALASAQSLAKRYPGVPQAHLLVGDTLATMGRMGPAATAYARAADLRFDEGTMLRLVDALDRSGQGARAGVALALFIAQNPQNLTARRLAGHRQIAAGDWDAAIDTLEGLRDRIGNRDAALLAELAAAYAGSGDLASAQSFASAAYDLAPLNPAVVDGYGWVLYQAGANAPALQLLDKAVAIAPDHPGLRWHQAQVEADLGQADDARTHIRMALANPAFADRPAAAALLKALG